MRTRLPDILRTPAATEARNQTSEVPVFRWPSRSDGPLGATEVVDQTVLA